VNASITAWPSLVKPMMGLGSVPAHVVASLPHTISTAIEGEGTNRVIDETGLNEPSHGPYALGTRARASLMNMVSAHSAWGSSKRRMYRPPSQPRTLM
jgi:hypothetical protein